MPRIPEQDRLYALSEPDRALWEKGLTVAGMDEVGRGPLAGPVVVCAAVMPSDRLVSYVNDSKKLSEMRREKVEKELRATAVDFNIAWVGPEVIDSVNILEATRLCFTQAFEGLTVHVDDVMIDALTGLKLNAKQHILIHGDATCYSIAAASILAKVARDAYMVEQSALYPEYGFERNKGYGTAEHIAALKKYGPCPIHRKSFIRNFVGE